MLTLRRAGERHHDPRRGGDAWLTFSGHRRDDLLRDGFGGLEVLDEVRLRSHAATPHRATQPWEIVTYVREGQVEVGDPTAGMSTLRAGEFQRQTAGRAPGLTLIGASRAGGAHAFQLSLRLAAVGPTPGHEHKRFSAADRRGGLCPVASPDARGGSLLLHADAVIFSALLDPGQHVVHALAGGRRAWLHLVAGEVTIGDVVLTTGDGAGVDGTRAASFTARQATEVLLIDLGPG